jgi:hypothetical protein
MIVVAMADQNVFDVCGIESELADVVQYQIGCITVRLRR